MLRNLRMRIAMWVSPELARYAEAGVADFNSRLRGQQASIALADRLEADGIKGGLIAYHAGVSLHQSGIHFKNKRAMETLYLPAPRGRG